MNRKSIGKLSIAAIASAVVVAFLLDTSAVESQLMEQCEQAQADYATSTCQVAAAETVSWFDWIGGKSRGYQFHFLDLLELLYSDDSDSDDSFHSSPTSSL